MELAPPRRRTGKLRQLSSGVSGFRFDFKATYRPATAAAAAARAALEVRHTINEGWIDLGPAST